MADLFSRGLRFKKGKQLSYNLVICYDLAKEPVTVVVMYIRYLNLC